MYKVVIYAQEKAPPHIKRGPMKLTSSDYPMEIRCQKRYHDNKLIWEKFSEGDEVYVFFHRNHVDRSSKFTYYWQGPYVVLETYSDLTYKVKHTMTGYQKVVHVDRMKRKYRRDETVEAIGENIEREVQREETVGPSTNFEEIGEEISNGAEERIEDDEALGRGRCQRCPPKKYSDYVV